MHPQMLVVPFLLWRELVPLDAVPVYGDVLVVVSVSMTKSCHQISEIFVTNQVSQLHLPKATRVSQQYIWLSLNLTKFSVAKATLHSQMSVRSSVTETLQQLEIIILHHSSFILHILHSSFIILHHPSLFFIHASSFFFHPSFNL